MKLGGEAKRKELITQFDELSLGQAKDKMTAEEAKIAQYGEKGQAEYLNDRKRK